MSQEATGMLFGLGKLFRRDSTPVVAKLSHPVLGQINFCEYLDGWLAQPPIRDLRMRFLIDGQHAPDLRLLAHAESIALDPKPFWEMINDFLEVESKRFTAIPFRSAAQRAAHGNELIEIEETIRSLEIDMLCLCWPETPDVGMIHFLGGEQYGLWRCDYISRRVKGLTFDR